MPERFWRYLLSGGAAAFLVSFVNPAGVGVWATSFGFISNHYLVSHTAEYLPPNFQDPSTWPFLLMIGLTLLLFGLHTRPLGAARLFPVTAWLVMGLYSVRNVPLFAIVAAPALAATLEDWLQANQLRFAFLSRFLQMDVRLRRTDLRLRGFLWPALVFGFIWAGFSTGASLDFRQQGNQFDAKVFRCTRSITFLPIRRRATCLTISLGEGISFTAYGQMRVCLSTARLISTARP